MNAGIADSVDHPLDPRYIELQRETGWITTAILTVISLPGLAIGVWTAASPVRGGLLVLGVLAALAAFAWWRQAWPPVAWRHASYRVDAAGLEIRRGVYFRSVINVPRSRVQHTDVAQGPLQRRHGLATLIVHTAGADRAEVDLPGLAHGTALAIRDHLLPGRADDAL